MSIEQIRDDVRSETITFGPHLVERMSEDGISMECPNGCSVSMKSVRCRADF
jgi:hypothetical protein